MDRRAGGWTALLIAALLVVPLLGLSLWVVTNEQRRQYNEDLTGQLFTSARMLREALRPTWERFDAGSVSGLVHALRRDGAVVVIASADGRVLADAAPQVEVTDRFLEQSEVRQALATGYGAATRSFGPGPPEWRAVAVRAGDDEATLGVVWLARPSWTLETQWRTLGRVLAAVAAIGLVAIFVLAMVLNRSQARVLRRLTQTARDISDGDLTADAAIRGDDAYAALSAAINRMRERLAAQLGTINRQRLTLAALVNQLQEGVVVTGPDGRIMLINPTAIRLVSAADEAPRTAAEWIGRSIEECVPQHALQRMLRAEDVGDYGPTQDAQQRAAGSQARPEPGRTTGASTAFPADRQIQLQVPAANGEVQILARAFDVRLPEPGREAPAANRSSADGDPRPPAPAGEAVGRMLVLTDVTELTRAVRARADFVANASHELRTPIAAIRAAVETLISIDPRRDAAAAKQFMESITRQTHRLEAMTSDLLDLARLESSAARFEPHTVDLRSEFDALYVRFRHRLDQKELTWLAAAAPDARVARAAPELLRLALENLVDNAIKFTDTGGEIRIDSRLEHGQVAVQVADTGCGIPEAEQQRVFERFFQVERARSGDERGTGLGLSIVRHTAAAMGGGVRLESQVGVGTLVTITLPRADGSGDTHAATP